MSPATKAPRRGGPAPGEQPRDFTYIKPRKRRLSEYEAVSTHIQPAVGDNPDWDVRNSYLRTRQGYQAWEVNSTRLRHPEWHQFRDPSDMWQRPYMRLQAEQERALGRLSDSVAPTLADEVDREWLDAIIAGHYAVWAFVEYGLYRALFPATREALSDTIVAAMLFETFDRARHQQDIVQLQTLLEENVPGFDSSGAKLLWMEEPRYQPMRQLIEELAFTVRDWAETICVINLVIDPILSDVAVHRLVGRWAPLHGDVLSRNICSTIEPDRQREVAWTEFLVRMVTAEDVPEAAANKAIIEEWLATWTPKVEEATRALAPLYAAVPKGSASFDEAFKAARLGQRELVAGLGLAGLEAV